MERLQSALDRFEQYADVSELQNLPEGPSMVRALDTFGGFEFRLAGESQVLDQASELLGRKKYVGAYSPESRRRRIELFHEKRKLRVWTRKVKYDVRKNFADTRMRVKGRFVKKEDEDLLKDLLAII